MLRPVQNIANLVRQTSIGYCSAFLLANIFRKEGYLSFVNKEGFKGCTDKEVNEMLSKNDPGIEVTTIAHCNESYGALPKDWIYNNILCNELNIESIEDVEIPIVPYLLSVHLVPGICHHVGVLVSGTRIFYIDPYFEHLMEIETFDDFDRLFVDCIEVQRFILNDGSRQYVVLKGESLNYHSLKENIVSDAKS